MKDIKIQDLQELQIVAQLVDNIEVVIDKLEDSYNKKDALNFENSKQEIFKFQKKIQEMLG